MAKTTVDTNLNKNFNIKRIGYNALINIQSTDDNSGLYVANILKITKGETKLQEGEKIFISKSELKINGRPHII